MALFKPLRGTSTDLAKVTPKDGYAYFCTDDGSFWIAYGDASGENVVLKRVNDSEVTKLANIIETVGSLNDLLRDHTHLVTIPAHETVETTITPAGSVTVDSYTPEGTVTSTFRGSSISSSGKYTPSGSISQPGFTGEEATISMTYTPEGSISYTPKGSVGSHAHNITSTTGTVSHMTNAGTAPSLTFDAGTLPSAELNAKEVVTGATFTAGNLPSWSDSYNAETENLTISWNPGTKSTHNVTTGVAAELTFNAGALPSADLNAGSMPTFDDVEVVTDVAAATVATKPTWSGTAETLTLSGEEATLSATYTPAGTVSTPSFTGTEGDINVMGTANGSIESTFAGEAATIGATFKGTAAKHKHAVTAINAESSTSTPGIAVQQVDSSVVIDSTDTM